MGHALLQNEYLTPEDYLWREQVSVDVKHEYINGQVYAMAGASRRHNQITINLITLLHGHVHNSPCQVFASDMKLYIQRPGDVRFYYPDIHVCCEEEDEAYYNTRPILIVEVLSESTSRIDRGEKLEAYKTIPTVQCILLVHSESECVELYERDKEWVGWVYHTGEKLPLSCINLELSIDDIYAQ